MFIRFLFVMLLLCGTSYAQVYAQASDAGAEDAEVVILGGGVEAIPTLSTSPVIHESAPAAPPTIAPPPSQAPSVKQVDSPEKANVWAAWVVSVLVALLGIGITLRQYWRNKPKL